MFPNRTSAGETLAIELKSFINKNVLVLALPRGGVPVAIPIAKMLKSPLDVIISRKIGAPFQPELALGALCEDGKPRWNHELLHQLNLQPSNLDEAIQKEQLKIKNYIHLFRQDKELSPLKNQTILLVDDGIATGATLFAAIDFLKKQHAKKIIVAVPVSSADTYQAVKKLVDQIVCLNIAENFSAVGEWYEDFSQVSSEEVQQLLNSSKTN